MIRVVNQLRPSGWLHRTHVRDFVRNHANMHPHFSQRNRRPISRLAVPHV